MTSRKSWHLVLNGPSGTIGRDWPLQASWHGIHLSLQDQFFRGSNRMNSGIAAIWSTWHVC